MREDHMAVYLCIVEGEDHMAVYLGKVEGEDHMAVVSTYA